MQYSELNLINIGTFDSVLLLYDAFPLCWQWSCLTRMCLVRESTRLWTISGSSEPSRSMTPIPRFVNRIKIGHTGTVVKEQMLIIWAFKKNTGSCYQCCGAPDEKKLKHVTLYTISLYFHFIPGFEERNNMASIRALKRLFFLKRFFLNIKFKLYKFPHLVHVNRVGL